VSKARAWVTLRNEGGRGEMCVGESRVRALLCSKTPAVTPLVSHTHALEHDHAWHHRIQGGLPVGRGGGGGRGGGRGRRSTRPSALARRVQRRARRDLGRGRGAGAARGGDHGWDEGEGAVCACPAVCTPRRRILLEKSVPSVIQNSENNEQKRKSNGASLSYTPMPPRPLTRPPGGHQGEEVIIEASGEALRAVSR